MGRKPIYPKNNCVGCDKCIYDKRHGNEICILTFETIEARKRQRCKEYINENKKAWRRKG